MLTNYTSSRLDDNLLHRTENFSPKYVQEQDPQRSTNVFIELDHQGLEIGPSNCSLYRGRKDTNKAKNHGGSFCLEIGKREWMLQN